MKWVEGKKCFRWKNVCEFYISLALKDILYLFRSKERKVLVDTKHDLSLNRQCKLLHVSKSVLYYNPVKPFSTDGDLRVLDAINNIYSDFPTYGSRRIHAQLNRDGYSIGKKFVKKAMKYMGIEALYTKPKMTMANKEHYKFPYLLSDFRDYAGRVVVEMTNQVWSTDITYIKLGKGFVYLAAIIDWHSKKILSWKLSNTMDGKGRATDNICIERFWRSIKYEEIYLNEYKNIKVLHAAISVYMDLYNKKRLHSAIGYQTPNEVYYQASNNFDSKGVKLLPQVS